MSFNRDEKIVVAVSGGMDPIHIGHVRLLYEASKLGDKLILFLNNDNWLMKKKGFVFMPQNERKEIIEHFPYVDEVFFTMHLPDTNDMSVCSELEKYRPNIFANGGDRFADNIPEVGVCKKIGCEIIFNVGKGGKIQSSSWLLDKYHSHKKKVGNLDN